MTSLRWVSWVAPLFMLAVLAVVLIAGGAPSVRALVIHGAPLLAVVAIWWFVRHRVRNRHAARDAASMIARLPTVRGPASLLTRHPMAAATQAGLRAQAYLLFEQPDAAERELAAVDLRRLPVMARAAHDLYLALCCYVRGDWRAGVNLATMAPRPLRSAPPRFHRSCKVVAAIGRGFLGEAGVADREVLADAFGSDDDFFQVLAAWGLTVIGGPEAPAATRFLARRAPHAPLLRRRPGAGHGASTARSAASSSER